MSVRSGWLVLAVLCAARLLIAASIGIVEDEAYYWTWSRHLAAGYLDHPPGIAWLIAPGGAMFGATSLGVRVLPVLAGIAAAGLLLPHAGSRYLYLLLVAGLPLFTLGGILATPDVPLLLGWAIALRGGLDGNWILAGIGAGVAGLGKFTGVGLWPLLLLGAPQDWRKMGPGIALTGFLLAPNLWWNATHDWVAWRFQLGHGLASDPVGAPLFLLGQVGVVTPILFAAMVAWWGSAWRTERLLVATSIPVVVFFTLAAARGPGEANWAAPAYLSAVLGLSRASGRIARAAWLGGGMAACFSVAVVVHLYRPVVDFPGDPTSQLGIGRDLAASVEAWGVEPVYTERYQEAALIEYYAGIDGVVLPGGSRPTQDDLAPFPASERALFVRPWRGGPTLASDPYCGDHGGANVVTEHNEDGTVFGRWQVYEVESCHL